MPIMDEFRPTWASPPSASIRGLLERRNVPIADAAAYLGVAPDVADQLLQSACEIDSSIAEKLSAALGATPEFWVTREKNFRAAMELANRREEEAAEREWLRSLPFADMTRFGWVPAAQTPQERVAVAKSYFDVKDLDQWGARYRKELAVAAFRTSPAHESSPASTAAWLRQAELQAERLPCAHWSPRSFEAALDEARKLTRLKDPARFLPRLQELCAECGVAVVVVRSPSGCRASGATRFLSPEKALVALSFRFRSDDQFWFTFFHEAGHLLLHAKEAFFLEDDSEATSEEEKEANAFAAELLIPLSFRSELERLPTNANSIIRFAVRVGVAPGIVVGQLQHMGRLGRDRLNGLKRRYVWHGTSVRAH